MAEQGERWPEGVFEIVWHQHNLDDWMADVRDVRTNQVCRLYSLAELERFIQAHLRNEQPQSVNPKK